MNLFIVVFLELNESTIQKAQESVVLKDDEPVTRVQIRMPYGQRPIIANFNESHTVADLRNFIVK